MASLRSISNGLFIVTSCTIIGIAKIYVFVADVYHDKIICRLMDLAFNKFGKILRKKQRLFRKVNGFHILKGIYSKYIYNSQMLCVVSIRDLRI